MNHRVRTNDTKSKSSAGLLTGLLIGGLAGYGTMMLFAPQSGKETRALIMQTSHTMQDQAADIFDELMVLSHFDSRKITSGKNEKNGNQ